MAQPDQERPQGQRPIVKQVQAIIPYALNALELIEGSAGLQGIFSGNLEEAKISAASLVGTFAIDRVYAYLTRNTRRQRQQEAEAPLEQRQHDLLQDVDNEITFAFSFAERQIHEFDLRQLLELQEDDYTPFLSSLAEHILIARILLTQEVSRHVGLPIGVREEGAIVAANVLTVQRTNELKASTVERANRLEQLNEVALQIGYQIVSSVAKEDPADASLINLFLLNIDPDQLVAARREVLDVIEAIGKRTSSTSETTTIRDVIETIIANTFRSE